MMKDEKYNRLTLIELSPYKNKQIAWLCKCVCGKEKVILQRLIKSGHTKSCGCLGLEKISKLNKSHGMTNTKEYRAWKAIKTRCYNTSIPKYKAYGERGIKVCDRWINSFENFLLDMGFAPGINYSIDRINNDGNYEPNNCKWSTNTEQCRNKRNNKILNTPWGKITQVEASEKSGVNQSTIFARLKNKNLHSDVFKKP